MLQIDNLQKNFGAVKALSDASLKVETGEIRALLGANGSGKSTLVKVLSGLNRKDGGTIRMDGREIDISSPAVSRKCRIAMAYQDLSLIPELSIEENLVLGKEPGRGMLQRKAIRAYACEMIDALGIQGRPEVQVGSLDLSNQALVEVAKALYIDPVLLLLDEITASMHHDQVRDCLTICAEKERMDCRSCLYLIALKRCMHFVRQLPSCAEDSVFRMFC